MMTTTSDAIPLLGRNLGDELRVRFKNIQTLTGNFAKSAVQDTHTFKIASALIASFTLVLARVYIATRSAKKEAATSGADSESTTFCKDQALMTTVREIGGFITSWLFMSLFNVAMDKPSQLLFGVRVNRHGVTGPIAFISKLGQQLIPFGNRVVEEALPKAVGCQRTLHILGEPSTFSAINPSQLETYYSQLKPNKVQLFFRKGLELLVNQKQLKKELSIDAFYKNLTPSLTTEQKAQALLNVSLQDLKGAETPRTKAHYKAAIINRGFNNFGTYVVPIVGASISTVVAGWMLERATLLHFPEIIDKINKLRLRKKPLEATAVLLDISTTDATIVPQPTLYLKQALTDDLPTFNTTLNKLQQPRLATAALTPTFTPALW